MAPFSAITAFGTLVFTFVNALRLASGTFLASAPDEDRPTNRSGLVTQLIAWAGGVAAITIAAHTQFAPDIQFGTLALNNMDGWTLVFTGLIASSLLSTFNQLKKAIDPSDSARMPSLLTGTTAPDARTAAVAAPKRRQAVVNALHEAENMIDLTIKSHAGAPSPELTELRAAKSLLDSALQNLS